MVDSVAVKVIIAAAGEQYINKLWEDFIGYKRYDQIHDRLTPDLVFITNYKNIAIKTHFCAPWSDTPDAHATTFARQIYCRQIECTNHGVAVLDSNKSFHFIKQMYACGLVEAKFLDDWEESANKYWRTTLPLFAAQFNKERRTLKRQHTVKN